MALDPIKLAQMLRNLPDQQLAPLAQGASPHVNPQEAQMEMMRRAQTRKSAETGKGGIAGLYEGGSVWEKLAQVLKDRNDNKTQQKRVAAANSENSVPTDVVQSRSRNMAAANSEASVPSNLRGPVAGPSRNMAAANSEASVPTELAPAAPPKKGIESIAETPAPKVDPAIKQTAGAITPRAPAPAAPGSPAPTSSAITTLAGPETPQPAPNDDLDNLDEQLNQRVQEQMKPFQAIYAARAEALKAGERDPLDMDAAKKERFYQGLLKFGTSLLASNAGTRAQRLGMAFDQGVQTFMQGMKEDKAKQEEIRQESLKIALQVQDNMLAEMGMGVEMRKQFGKELLDVAKERRERKKDENDAQYRKEQIRLSEEGLEVQREGNRLQYKVGMARTNDGGSKEKAISYENALKQATDELESDKIGANRKLKGADREAYINRRAAEIMIAQQRILQAKASGEIDAIGAAYPGAPAVPEGVRVTQVKP